jgi:plastocyanin
MQAEVACEQDVVVQANDSLSKLAQQFYGDVMAFPAIVEATNAKAATDSSYANIENASVVAVGSKLCIPSPADAKVLLEESGSGATAAADPTVDRVGFPEGYQENFILFYEFDRPDNKTARVIYANEAAASVQPGQPFPYGSILVMDVYRTPKDDAGNVLLDENGRYMRDELAGHFIMRKEPGFGAKYGQLRNGEWEYVAYRPDGTFQTPPERTNGCAGCHVEAGFGKDWVFGAHRFFGEEAPEVGENEVNVVDYTFQQNDLTVKVGTEVQWVGNDVTFHTVTANDMSFSGALRPQGSFSHTFEQAGVFEYFCGIHPSMKGRIEVVP